ncbi:fimbria/pilus outer membrane usher protein [Burkholderia pyrrocinia]|uniref:Fimbria/pilus outer membrane usher protein n=1 Tax=Burkholderia pyrrocinia TaxID=60550 RepID=A0ABZ3BN65_BURPY
MHAVLLGCGLLPLSVQAGQDAAVFNSEFLKIGGVPTSVDLSVFAFGNRVLPGTYVVGIRVNEESFGKETLEFVQTADDADAVPCLTRENLSRWRVNTAAFADGQQASCITLQKLIAGAQVHYDAALQELQVSVPQAAMERTARGYVPPEKLDVGETAALLNYQFNGTHDYRDARDSAWLNLRGGLNLGSWRLRKVVSYTHQRRYRGWQSPVTSAERDLIKLKARLTIGDSVTPGDIFDSFLFRGVQLQSDDAMFPDSMRGYAPTVRGIARSAALVTVRQNGYVVGSLYVPPGPFVIDDLYATPGGGDLEVTVAEAGGRVTRFVQPYSALPTMLREGRWTYNVMAGQYRDAFSGAGPRVTQLTLAHGLAGGVTGYGGMIVSNAYRAAVLGVSLNMQQFGGVALDVTRSQFPGARQGNPAGSAVRLTYAKSLPSYGTEFRMLGYRYTTDGYRSLAQAVRERARLRLNDEDRVRSQFQVSLSQRLGNMGTFYASATRQTFRSTSQANTVVQLGFSGSMRSVAWSVDYNEISMLRGSRQRQISLMLTLPLGRSNASASYQVGTDGSGQVNQQAGMFGTLLRDSNLSYSASVDKQARQDPTAYASLSYLGSKGRVGVSHTQGPRFSQSQMELSGALVADRRGVLFSQPLGETAGIVEVDGASNIAVDGNPGVRTDAEGRAVVPSLVPYRLNRIALDVSSAGSNVSLSEAVVSVAPTRGAVARAVFKADIGYQMLVRVRLPDGREAPFGGLVLDGDGKEKSVVGTGGRVFMAGLRGRGQYALKLEAGEGSHCTFELDPASRSADEIMQVNEITCRPERGQ